MGRRPGQTAILVISMAGWCLAGAPQAGASGAQQSALEAVRRPSSRPVEPGVAAATFAPATTGYRTEEEWVVSEVAAAIVGMADYGRTGRAVPRAVAARAQSLAGSLSQDAGSFIVTASPDFRRVVHIRGHLWAPDNYAALARTLLVDHAGAGGTSARSGAGTDASSSTIVQDLTDLRVDRLLAENRRVSGALTADITSAAAHEEAALLLAAFILRESAGPFSDVRSTLSRMSAHLALAQALRERAAPGDTAARTRALAGTLAHVVLLASVGRDRDALAMLQEAEAGDQPGAESWIRALQLQITGDWREGPGASATRLEQLAHARARCRRLGGHAARDYADAAAREPATDWPRLVLSCGLGAESGYRFTQGNQRELDEIARVWGSYAPDAIGATPGASSQAAARRFLLLRLNDLPSATGIVSPQGKPEVQVLDWGRWAPFLQRHLSAAVRSESRHQWVQNRDEARKAFTATLEPTYGHLRLFPVLRRHLAQDADQYARAMQDALTLAGTHPELVTAPMWHLLLEKPEYQGAVRVPFARPATWFAPAVPTGTVMDMRQRVWTPHSPATPTLTQVGQWAHLAPYHTWVAWMKVWQETRERPTAADAQQAFGELAEYDTSALVQIVEHTSGAPDDHAPVARRLCELDAARCAGTAPRQR